MRLTVDLPVGTHRDLIASADALASETGKVAEFAKLIVPMIEQFTATDRAFAKARRPIAPRALERRSKSA